MSSQRPCHYQIGDRVIYGGAEGCNPRYEGYGARVVSIGGYHEHRDTYSIRICFDNEADCPIASFATLEHRIQPICDLSALDVEALL